MIYINNINIYIAYILRSHVVYKLNCEGCNAFYIGKTTAHVSFRIKNEISGKENSGALEHMMECGREHYFVVKNTQVLCSEKHDYKLLIKESLMVQHLIPPLNKNVKVFHYIYFKFKSKSFGFCKICI